MDLNQKKLIIISGDLNIDYNLISRLLPTAEECNRLKELSLIPERTTSQNIEFKCLKDGGKTIVYNGVCKITSKDTEDNFDLFYDRKERTLTTGRLPIGAIKLELSSDKKTFNLTKDTLFDLGLGLELQTIHNIVKAFRSSITIKSLNDSSIQETFKDGLLVDEA